MQVRVDFPPARAGRRAVAADARRFLTRLGLSGCELSIAIVSDAEIRRVNRQWRRKDRATDVLSFPAGPVPDFGSARAVLGDVVLSWETAARRGSPRAELRRYLAHGLLHLLGYDHVDPRQARTMARMETRLLGAGGMLLDLGLLSRSR